DPGNFVGKKFDEKKHARDRDHRRMREDVEPLVLREQHDPMLVNREAGEKNGEVKIDAREAGESERDGEKLQRFHFEKISAHRLPMRLRPAWLLDPRARTRASFSR